MTAIVTKKHLALTTLVLILALWAIPALASPLAASPGDIVINEIMQNPAAVSDTNGEYFEVFNATGSGIDINGWTLRDDGVDSHVITNGGPLVVPAGGFLVLGRDANSGANGGVSVDYQYSSFFLSNSADEVILEDGSSTEIDRVEYDGGPSFPDPTGASMALVSPAFDNNVGANWCTSSTPFGSGDLGTPGSANDCSIPPTPTDTPVGPTNTPLPPTPTNTPVGPTNTPPPTTPTNTPLPGGTANPGDVIVNEIMQNPAAVSDTNGEYFEVFNTTGAPIDIDGWTIRDDGSNTHVISNGGPLNVPAGGFLILGRDDDIAANGGVAVDYEYSGFFLGNSDDEVILEDATAIEINRVEYDGGPNFPDPNGASMALVDPSLDNNDGSNWCTSSTPFGAGDSGTPGAVNDCPPPPPEPGVCGELATFIHAIQGNGFSSPLVGEVHVVEGVIVGDYQGSSGLNGFFVQEEDSDVDGDPATSEGLFVSDSSFGVDVADGDIARVQGTVSEFFGLTRLDTINSVQVCLPGSSASASTVIFPLSSVGDLEAYEGMLVTFPQTLYASGNFNQGRFGEVDLSVGGAQDNPTNVVAPGAPANALQDLNNRSRIQLDDGSNMQNPLPLPPYIGAGGTLRTGDSVTGLTAAMGYAFGLYELHPTSAVNFTRVNVRTSVPNVGGTMQVAAYNVLNYFTTLDNAGPICGPLGNQGCRGADNAFEFTRQRDKIIDAISQLDADVVGLMEIENAADNTPEADLVAGLNAATTPGKYDFIASGPIGGDAIRVALLYQPASVTPLGGFEVLDSSDDPLFDDTLNRPMLTQSFMENATGEVFTVGVNHLKSKGSSCSGVGDPDTGDGQGNCNITRTNAAQAIVDFLATDPTGSGDSDYLIIGDLNAYAQEDPIVTVEAGGYTDLIEAYVGSGYGAGAYSFNFFSQSGYLDHGLSSATMTAQVTDAALWHTNADEPRALDYNDFNQPALYNPDQFRASDHDPVLIGLDLLPTVRICDIQAAGHLSPYAGQEVITTGVVTALAFNGYYVQDASTCTSDAEPLASQTSDGIFVFKTGSKPSIGDHVLLQDTVTEFIPGGPATGNLSTTQMSFPTLVPLGTTPLPSPVILGSSGRIPPAVDVITDAERPVNLQNVPGVFNPDNDGIDFYESVEGMLVTIEDPVAVSGTRTFSAFASEVFTLTNNGANIAPIDARTARGGINLQPDPDNDGDQNPERVQIQFDPTLSGGAAVPAITVGDRLNDVTGVVGYSFGNFEVNATHQVAVLTPSGLGGETTSLLGTNKLVTVASYNVLNLSPLSSDDAQRATLADQIVNNLGSPDVIALQEIQDNNGTTDDGTTDATLTLQALADAVVLAGGPTYSFFDVAPADGTGGGVPGGNIRNAFFYNADRVKLEDFVSLTPDVLSDFGADPAAFDGTRDPLLATFKFKGKEFIVINNHLSSRFGSTPVFGGPQPFVQAGETERAAQTGALNVVVDALLTSSQGNGNASKAIRVIVLGDLNTMEFTNEMTETLPGAGPDRVLTNLIDGLPAEDDNKYTFNFEGNSQVLDHMFVTDNLLNSAEFDIVHVNVDFPRVDNTVGSDHEPLLGRFDPKDN